MDTFEQAFKLGQEQACTDFVKESDAKDIAELLKFLGKGTSKGLSGLGKALKGTLGGAQATGRGAKYLGITADPRMALAGGLGLAGLGATFGDDIAQLGLEHGLKSKAVGAVPALLGAGGGLLAAGANPGLMGGSAINRITHEIAMSGATPAGTFKNLVGLVGVPAALLAYGKMKGKEESSIF